jgi:hypothetical protein
MLDGLGDGIRIVTSDTNVSNRLVTKFTMLQLAKDLSRVGSNSCFGNTIVSRVQARGCRTEHSMAMVITCSGW